MSIKHHSLEDGWSLKMLRLFCNTRKFNFFLNCALFTYLSVLHWCFALYNLILRIHCHKTNTTGVTSGEGTAYPPESPGFIPVFSGVCVAQSLVFYVVFCRSLCGFFSYGQCFCLSFAWRLFLTLFDIFNLFLTTPATQYSIAMCIQTGKNDR